MPACASRYWPLTSRRASVFWIVTVIAGRASPSSVFALGPRVKVTLTAAYASSSTLSCATPRLLHAIGTVSSQYFEASMSLSSWAADGHVTPPISFSHTALAVLQLLLITRSTARPAPLPPLPLTSRATVREVL